MSGKVTASCCKKTPQESEPEVFFKIIPFVVPYRKYNIQE